MGRRIRWLGVVMILCFALICVQLANIQFAKAHKLATSPYNPRVAVLKYDNPRGTIYAADGTTVLAKSVRTTPGKYNYLYHYIRQYPDGPLYAGPGTTHPFTTGYGALRRSTTRSSVPTAGALRT
jgi:peptidoglycan glycosyltransferase